jgi:hypothetical protein
MNNLTDWTATDWTAFGAMVQAGSTVVLVCITAAYVYWTYRLVRAQEQPLSAIRLAAQEAAARSLAAAIRPRLHFMGVMGKRFPLDLTKKPSGSDFDNQDLETLMFDLSATAPQLAQPLAGRCFLTSRAVSDAVLSLIALQLVINREANNAATANRAWSWDEARKIYLTEVRQQVNTRPEWEEIVAGKAVSEADELLRDLDDLLTKYLLSDPTVPLGTGSKQ